MRRPGVPDNGTVSEPYAAPSTSRPWWRSLLAALLLVVVVVLAPVAVVSAWAKAAVVSTDGFVDTFGPLADRPEVQQTVTTRTVAAVEDRLSTAGLPDALVTRLGSALTDPVEKFVASDSFQSLWDDSLRSLHTQVAEGNAQGSSDSGVTVGAQGQVDIRLGPIVAAVRTDLVDQGVTGARLIPEVDGTVPVATVRDLSQAHRAYRLTDLVGTWAPPLTIGCLVVGLLVANRRRVALAWTGAGVALAMGATWVAVDLGRAVVADRLSGQLTRATVDALWDGSVDGVRQLILYVGAGALVVAVLAGLSTLVRRRS